MTHGSLFSGIGGFDLAAEWMGWKNVFHCEWNDFGQKVLKYYWPKAISYNDITKTDFTIHRGQIDILTGGFPCQPYSMAGKRKGKEDERHLWPEMLRAIREIQPRWVMGENVFGLINWSGGLVFHEVQTDLEAAGYEVWPYVLPACAVNAPHRRDRVWFVAHNNSFIRGKRWEYQCRKQPRYRESNESGNTKINGNAFHCNSNGQQRSNGQHEVNAGEGGQYAQRNFEQMGRDVADTGNTGLEGSKVGGSIGESRSQSHKLTSRCFRTDWDNFPTQSPVRTRNDGFSSQLDGITFSKWRNESIKAAGNAIVPQVAFQIFKAIEQYDRK